MNQLEKRSNKTISVRLNTGQSKVSALYAYSESEKTPTQTTIASRLSDHLTFSLLFFACSTGGITAGYTIRTKTGRENMVKLAVAIAINC